MQYFTALQGLDWLNLVAGALLGALLGLIVWTLTRAYESWVGSRDLPYPIGGTWFSAEFDPKGDASRGERNTFTQVKVRRGLGGTFSVRVVKGLPRAPSRPETAWRASGKVLHGDTLVGTWQSTVKHTKRFGAASIKFVDYGRAVGYWIGPAGKDYPVYGYWLMSRRESDLRMLAKAVMRKTQFEFFDVVRCVLDEPPSEKVNSSAV